MSFTFITTRHAAMLTAASLALLVALPAFAAPKRLTSAKPDNCSACHGKDKVLPEGHAKTAKMALSACRECHTKDSPTSLSGKLPLSHRHQLAGVTCVKCHGKAKKQTPVEAAVCETCHEPARLAEKTAGVKPQNPHTSPHYGTALDCNVCHHQHAKSENFCIQCHTFNFKLP